MYVCMPTPESFPVSPWVSHPRGVCATPGTHTADTKHEQVRSSKGMFPCRCSAALSAASMSGLGNLQLSTQERYVSCNPNCWLYPWKSSVSHELDGIKEFEGTRLSIFQNSDT